MQAAFRAIPVVIAVLLCAVPAGAEESAAELLRLGRVAETVEGDAQKALELYQRALELDPNGVRGAEAAWAIARVHESRGKTSEALEAPRALTQRFAGVMTEIRKREVHDALLRLLPPGSQEPSPLGTIYVAASAADTQPAVSPLKHKIREMLDRYVQVGGADQARVRAQLWGKLQAVGTDALPILIRIAREDSPSRSTTAARLLAKLGKADALDGLVELATKGDAITRQSAVEAFNEFRRSGDVPSDRVVGAIDALLALELSATERYTLREVLDEHLTPAARLERHLAGGEWAMHWLERALETQAPGALERALELIRGGGEQGRRALVALLPLLLPKRGYPNPSTYPVDSLGAKGAVAALDLLLVEPWTGAGGSYGVLAPLARVIEKTAGEVAGANARERIWHAVAAIEPPNEQRSVASFIGNEGLTPPASMLADTAFAAELLDLVADRGGRLYRDLVALGQPFWEAFFDTLPHLGVPQVRALLQSLQNNMPQGPSGPGPLPAAYDRRWIDLLEQIDLWDYDWAVPRVVVQAAARSGDPRFLDLVRKYSQDRNWHPYQLQWIENLNEYDGPGRLAFVEDALKDEDFPTQRSSSLLRALVGDASPGSRELLVRIASDWGHPLSRSALSYLHDAEATSAVLRIAQRVRSAPEDVPVDYRKSLIHLVRRMHVREAVPFLIDEFRRGPLAKTAAGAMDDIRDYHRRLETFERFAKAGKESSSAEPKRKVEDLLEDEDAAIRRAAVIALGALGRPDVLDRLVYLAKEDPDEAVRKAALEAARRIAAD